MALKTFSAPYPPITTIRLEATLALGATNGNTVPQPRTDEKVAFLLVNGTRLDRAIQLVVVAGKSRVANPDLSASSAIQCTVIVYVERIRPVW